MQSLRIWFLILAHNYDIAGERTRIRISLLHMSLQKVSSECHTKKIHSGEIYLVLFTCIFKPIRGLVGADLEGIFIFNCDFMDPIGHGRQIQKNT